MRNHLFRLNQFFIKSSITLKPKIEHIVICCFLMGDCLLPIFVHSGNHQISPSFCSLVGPCQEIKANFVFGTLKNTKKWKIRSVFIFIIFPSTTKLRANSPIKKLYHLSTICCQKVCSMNVGDVPVVN